MRNILLFFMLITMGACRSPEARKPIVKTSGHFLEQSASRNKKLQAQQEKHIQNLIKKDSTHQYFGSSHGFWYRYDEKKELDTLTPHYGDLVKFNYDIATLEGKIIYSRKTIGAREYLIDKEDIFKGLRLGLKLMKPGETVTFYFPSYMAFGYYGDQEKIGRNTPIRSTVTLYSIEKNYDNTIKQPSKSKHR